MVAALTYTPIYPEPGETVTLAISGSAGDPNYSRFGLAVVPNRSALELGMLVDINGAYIKTFVPDVAGRYEIDPYDVRAFLGQPQSSGDAASEPRQVVIAKISRSYVHVVSFVDMRIATLPGHDITLRFGLAEDIIVSAELVEPSTDLARLAALSTNVVASLAGLVGDDISTVATTLVVRVTALRTAFEAHRILTAGAVHASADTTNVTNYEPPNSDDTALACLQDLYAKIIKHTIAGISGGTWHTNDDTKNSIITPLPLTKAQAIVTLSDLEWRVYEPHRVLIAAPIVHGAADNTNTLAAPNELTTLIVNYLNFIAANTAITISGENSGLGEAERVLGMTAAP